MSRAAFADVQPLRAQCVHGALRATAEEQQKDRRLFLREQTYEPRSVLSVRAPTRSRTRMLLSQNNLRSGFPRVSPDTTPQERFGHCLWWLVANN